MSMVRYGSFPFEANECNVVRVERGASFSPRNKKLIDVYRMSLEVVVKKDTVAELTSRIHDIQVAFGVNYNDVALYTDDAGTVLSAHYLTNSDSLSGVRVIRGPVFDRADGAEYANKRTAVIVLESTYDASDGDLVSWRETLRFIGTGGQDYAILPSNTGSVAFPLGSATPQVIVQTGEAVGFVAPITPPGPIFTSGVYLPATLQEEGWESGQSLGQVWAFYPSNWRYVMYALTPQTGYPTTR